jgi:thiamine-monophosphate kinase
MTEPFDRERLGEGAEFDKIRHIWRRLGSRAVGGGDDCAFVPAGEGLVAIGTDLAIEGVHFRVGWLAPHEIGWRATVASLSDLAAVAAVPVGVLVSLGVSPEWPDEMVAELMDGVGEAVRAAGTTVVGGDLVRSDRLVIDVVATGRVTDPVLRSGANVGDGLWVSGGLGGPAVALAAWERNQEPERTARARFAAPEPRLQEARWLKERGARAMIDVSDGLVADAGHLAAASGVRCVIETEWVPVHASVTDKTTALVSGEEYELLCALPQGAEVAVSGFADAFGVPLTRIGRVEEGSGVEVLRLAVPIEIPTGFRHF